MDAVRAAARARTSQAALELPGALFAEQPSGWQPVVRGHLQAALDATPGGRGRLADAIAAAHAELDQPNADHAGPADEQTPPDRTVGPRLLEELRRAGAHLHRQGCGDGAAAVGEAIRRLTRQEAQR